MACLGLHVDHFECTCLLHALGITIPFPPLSQLADLVSELRFRMSTRRGTGYRGRMNDAQRDDFLMNLSKKIGALSMDALEKKSGPNETSRHETIGNEGTSHVDDEHVVHHGEDLDGHDAAFSSHAHHEEPPPFTPPHVEASPRYHAAPHQNENYGNSYPGFGDDITHKVRVDAPSFDGRSDPNAFIDCMDRDFDWYNMTEDRRVRP